MKSNYERDGLHVRISTCMDPVDPRADSDCNTAVFAFSHRRYDLGDVGHSYKPGDYHGWDGMRRAIVAKEKPVSCLPVYMLDHSGRSFSTSPFSCATDSGQIGWAFVPGSSGLTEDQAKEEIQSELKAYAEYLEGELYDGEVRDMLTGEVVESWYCYSEKSLEEEINNFFTLRSREVPA